MGVAGSDISSVPKVSVIIPAYNSGKYISGCLQNLTGQTLQEIEIIAVNDGSTDDTLKIIESFAGKDNRIKVINQSRQMRGAAGNNGMKAASGSTSLLRIPIYVLMRTILKNFSKLRRNMMPISLWHPAKEQKTAKSKNCYP